MSITVRTEYGTDNHPQASRWDVTEHGGLWVIATDRTVAEYPPGAWWTVTLDEEPQDDQVAPDDEVVHFTLPPSPDYRVMLAGRRFTIASVDFHRGGDTAVLHARAEP